MCVEFLLDTSNLRYQEIIYSVQGGLRVRTGVEGNGLKYTNKFTRNIFLITSSAFMEMGYKYYNLHYNWIGRSFGHSLGYALLQGRMRSDWGFCSRPPQTQSIWWPRMRSHLGFCSRPPQTQSIWWL